MKYRLKDDYIRSIRLITKIVKILYSRSYDNNINNCDDEAKKKIIYFNLKYNDNGIVIEEDELDGIVKLCNSFERYNKKDELIMKELEVYLKHIYL